MSDADPNPFRRVGRKHDLMIDRPSLLARIRTTLESGRSLVLVGPTGAGKSQLVRAQYKRYFNGLEFLPHVLAISLELAPAADQKALLQALHHRFRKELERRGFDWGEVPWVADFTLELPDLLGAFDQLLRAFQDEGLDVIVMIDPVDPASYTRLAPVFDWLAAWSDRGIRLVLVTSDLETLPPSLANRLEPIEVGPLSIDAATRFLSQPLVGHPHVFTEVEISALIAASGGYPARLHALAAEALHQKLAQPRRDPEPDPTALEPDRAGLEPDPITERTIP